MPPYFLVYARSFVTNFFLCRQNRIAVLEAFSNNLLDAEEFLLLYDLNKSKTLDLPYWQYERFDLDHFSDDECRAEFRFLKNDIYTLFDVLNIPDELKCYNGYKCCGLEGLCIYLKRFAYPCRHFDTMPRFGLPVPQLSKISNLVMNFVYNNWGHLLRRFNQDWLSPLNLENYSQVIHDKCAPLNNCWAFVDGTVRKLWRPGTNQRILYNGHKKVHAIKFQSVATPNGLVANLFGPVEGRRHDSFMLASSGLLPSLTQHARDQNGNILCIYGDPAYPLRPQLQTAYKGANLTQLQKDYNKAMNATRVSVEWVFGDILNYWKFLDFHKNLKIQLSAVGKMYAVCVLFQNARSCFYGSLTSDFFDCAPPCIDEYFQ